MLIPEENFDLDRGFEDVFMAISAIGSSIT